MRHLATNQFRHRFERLRGRAANPAPNADRGDRATAARPPAVNRRRLSCFPALALSIAVLVGSAASGFADDSYVVLKAKKVITITGEEISDAMIVISGGKIEAVGKKVDYPSESRVIDVSNLTVMPGMISPHSAIGLPPANRNGNQSHRRVSSDFLPPDDDTYSRLLQAGYTMLGLYPPGGGMPGQKLVQTTSQPQKRAGLKEEGLIRVSFTRPATDKRLLRDTIKQAQAVIDKENEATSKSATSRPAAESRPTSQPTSVPASGPSSQPATTRPATASAPVAPPPRPELEPWLSLLKKKEGFVAQIELARASDIIHLADVLKDADFARHFVVSGWEIGDMHQVVAHDLLGHAKALVAITPTLPNMPLTMNPYNLAQRFINAGATVAIFPLSDTVEEYGNIRERLAMLVRAGLDRKDALKAVTLNAARFLLMDKEYGSIEKDKWADLILLDGDPLDPASKVRRVMIHGEFVFDLDKKDSKQPPRL
ncbi:MAG: amidohydrolase family protein [Phycisphaerae bacterium]|nr:amidohydrolase family protein [Phycisphaerae bacterium]